jgi:uncharacterized protein (DUF433 family)
MKAELVPLISIDPAVCHGQPCISGTRIMVSVVLDNLAAGMSHGDILRDYPALTDDGIRAAIAHAADLARREGDAAASAE